MCWLNAKRVKYEQDIRIANELITEVNNAKFLSVILDNKLNWCHHISRVHSRVSKALGIILKARKVFNTITLLSFVII